MPKMEHKIHFFGFSTKRSICGAVQSVEHAPVILYLQIGKRQNIGNISLCAWGVG